MAAAQWPTHLIGQRFGKLTILAADARRPQSGNRYALCRCDCGQEKSIRLVYVLKGHSTSCGCHGRAMAAMNCHPPKPTHGLSRRPEYFAWAAMINRCYNTQNKSFHNYGGRGISVCKRWKESVANFFSDMGVRPSSDHSLDRIDTNGNYEPTNCRWAPFIQQRLNQRNTQFLTFNDETLPLTHWAARVGIHQGTLYRRINRLRWSVERALTESPTQYRHRHS